MGVPLGLWAGASVALLVALLALRRPIIARMGLGQAFSRPRQLPLIACGLMVATAVIAASGIVADSMGASLRDSATARLGAADVAVVAAPAAPLDQATVDALLADQAVAPLVAARSDALRLRTSVSDARSGLGEPVVALWGVDPVAARRLGGLSPVEGVVPADEASWPADAVVVNEALAERLDGRVGDPLTLYARVPTPAQPAWTNETGRLVLATESPAGGYVHSAQDQYEFTFDVAPGTARLVVTTAGAAAGDLDIEAIAPDGTVFLDAAGSATAPRAPRVELGPEEVVEGPWTLRVHGKGVANASFTLGIAATPDGPGGSTRAEMAGRLAAIVSDDGADPLERGPAAFVARDALAALTGAKDRVDVVLVAATSGRSPVALADALRGATYRSGPTPDDDAARPAVTDLRTSATEEADEFARGTRQFFLFLGSFSILAGVLLIATLMSLLVEERKRALATTRAVGGTRGHLTALHVHEGAAYAAFAAVLGLVVGIGLSVVLLAAANVIFPDLGTSFRLALRPGTLAGAAGAGFALTIAVIAAAADRAGRFNIARALRAEEEPPRRLTWPVVAGYGLLLLAGLGTSAAGVATGDPLSAVLGPTLLALGLAGLLVRRLRRERVYPLVGGALAVYLGASFFFLTDLESDIEFLSVPLRGLLIAIAGTMVLVYSPAPSKAVAALLRRVPGVGAVADPAMAYVRGRHGRTGLTVAMLALVVLMLVLMGTVMAIFAPDIESGSGGFDVLGTTAERINDPRAWLAANPPPGGADPLAHVEVALAAPILTEGLVGATVDGGEVFSFAGEFPTVTDLLGVTPQLAAGSAFVEVRTDPRFADLSAALAAVATDPALAVAADHLGVERGGPENPALAPGEVITLSLPSGPRDVTVAAILGSSSFGALMVHPDVIGDAATGTRLFVRAADGADPVAVSREVEAGFRHAGMDAIAVSEIASDVQRQMDANRNVIQLFVGLGLLIGIASLGLVTARNVIERRHEVGVLRAVGATPRQVLAVFACEILYIVTLAVVIGLAGGLVAAYGLFVTAFEESGLEFTVEPLNIGAVLVALYVAAVLAAVLPARAGAKVPPAQATRYVE